MLHNKWLRLLSLVMVLGILGGCATPTPEVVKETVVVEKVVTQVVKETVKETVVVEGTPQVVEKEVTKIVEKVVTPPPAPGTAEEAKSKSIVLAAHTDILSLDPHRIMEIWGSFVLNHCYDTLLALDPQDASKIVPSLAEEWEVSPDATVYTFKLRPDVKFTTGNPLTADDVIFSFNRLKNLKGLPSVRLEDIDTVEAIDDMTVQITTKAPNVILPYLLTGAYASIVDSKELSERGGLDTPDAAEKDKAEQFLNDNSVGSGPFILASNEPDYKVVLTKNPNYWGQVPQLDEVVLLTVSDPSAQRFMVERGDADVAFNLSAEQVDAMRKNSDIKIVGGPTTTFVSVEMTKKPDLSEPMANPTVEMAIRYALDYDGYLALAGGYADRIGGVVPQVALGGLPQEEWIQRDVEKAKELLAEAGYPDGFDVKLSYESTGVWYGVSISSMAEKMQADLAEVGINVTLDPQEGMIVYQMSRRGELEMMINLWGGSYFDGYAQLRLFCPGEQVAMRYDYGADLDPEIRGLCDEAKTVPDPEERARVYQEIQRQMNERSPWIGIMSFGAHLAVRDEVENFVYHPGYQVQLQFVDKK